MSFEEGRITRTAGDRAWVLVRRSTMCERCDSRSACHALGGESDMEAESINTAGATTGDRVVIRIGTRSLLGIAFLFYLVPTAALLAGALTGLTLAPRLGMDPEPASLLFAVAGLLIMLAIVIAIGKKLKKNRNYLPEVTKILSPHGQDQEGEDTEGCGERINRP